MAIRMQEPVQREQVEDGLDVAEDHGRVEGLGLVGVEEAILVHGAILADGAALPVRRPLHANRDLAGPSWPHAASMSTPRLRRTVTVTPAAASRAAKRLIRSRSGAWPCERAGRVERDEVDVRAAAQAGQAAGEHLGLLGEVVDARDAGVLEGDPPALDRGVLARRRRGPS